MIVKLNKWQLMAFGLGAVSWGAQTWGGWKVLKVNDQLIKTNKLLHENGNRGAYLSMYLLVKLIENNVELDEFDQQVMNNPPKLVDADNPNLFAEFLKRCEETGYDEDKARQFFSQLKKIREEDE